MARYNLLTDDERHRLFDIPIGRAALIRHYTLAPEEPGVCPRPAW